MGNESGWEKLQTSSLAQNTRICSGYGPEQARTL